MTVLFLSFLIGELHFFYAHPKTREYELDELTLSFPDMSKAPFMVHINLYISCDRGPVCIKKRNLRLSGFLNNYSLFRNIFLRFLCFLYPSTRPLWLGYPSYHARKFSGKKIMVSHNSHLIQDQWPVYMELGDPM